MIDSKGTHYPKDVILYAVFFYVRYAVSCRDSQRCSGLKVTVATTRDIGLCSSLA